MFPHMFLLLRVVVLRLQVLRVYQVLGDPIKLTLHRKPQRPVQDQ